MYSNPKQKNAFSLWWFVINFSFSEYFHTDITWFTYMTVTTSFHFGKTWCIYVFLTRNDTHACEERYKIVQRGLHIQIIKQFCFIIGGLVLSLLKKKNVIFIAKEQVKFFYAYCKLLPAYSRHSAKDTRCHGNQM